MSVFPISGPGLALGTSSSKKRSVGAERRAAPRVVPSRCPGRAGAVGGPPDPVPANGAAPLLSARSVGLRYVTHENRVLRAGGQESNPSQSNLPQRTGDPRSATSPERVSELATLPYLRPELGGWLYNIFFFFMTHVLQPERNSNALFILIFTLLRVLHHLYDKISISYITDLATVSHVFKSQILQC